MTVDSQIDSYLFSEDTGKIKEEPLGWALGDPALRWEGPDSLIAKYVGNSSMPLSNAIVVYNDHFSAVGDKIVGAYIGVDFKGMSHYKMIKASRKLPETVKLYKQGRRVLERTVNFLSKLEGDQEIIDYLKRQRFLVSDYRGHL